MKPDVKILVVHTAFIGDVILATPLFKAIKQALPHSTVDALVDPRAAAVVENNPHLHTIWRYDKRGKQSGLNGLWSIIRRLRIEGYDVVLAPHRSWRTALMARFSGASVRIGFDNSRASGFYTTRVRYDRSIHEVRRNLALLRGLEINVDSIAPEIFPDDQDRSSADRFFTMIPNATAVAVAPGSIWPTKRWPEEHFLTLCALLVKHGVTPLLIGGADDDGLARRIAAASDQIINTAGMLSVRASAELIRRCRLLVTNDSAPLHLASAVSTPTLALFGPTVPEFGFGPFHTHSSIMELKLACRPCGIHGGNQCPIKTHICMRELSVETVFNQVVQMIEKK